MIHRLQRIDGFSWAIMPHVIERIYKFCASIDTDTNPDDLCEQTARMFAAGDVRLGLWAILMPDHKVVAHLLALPEPVTVEAGPWQYCLIRQAQVDRRVDVRKDCRAVFQNVQDWTKSLGMHRIVMVTHRNETAMLRRWGFQPYKSIMDLHI